MVLVNKRCSSLPPLSALLCMASKYGLSGDGRGAWDHAAVVFRDRVTNVPYLLEGDQNGVTLRTFEERLLQGSDHQEVQVLPLRGAESDIDDKGRRPALGRFVDVCAMPRRTAAACAMLHPSRAMALPALFPAATLAASTFPLACCLAWQDLGLSRVADGFDGKGSCCENTWAVYRDIRSTARARGQRASKETIPVARGGGEPCCRFGAPLVAAALQRLGVLDPSTNPATVTPMTLLEAPLEPPALFGRPVPLSSM